MSYFRFRRISLYSYQNPLVVNATSPSFSAYGIKSCNKIEPHLLKKNQTLPCVGQKKQTYSNETVNMTTVKTASLLAALDTTWKTVIARRMLGYRSIQLN
jgi:hypothetical protein